MNEKQAKILLQTFAGLYFDKESIREFLHALNLDGVDLDGRLTEIWQRILAAVDEADKVDALIEQALTDFPNKKALKYLLAGGAIIPLAPSFVAINDEPKIEWTPKDRIENFEKIIGERNSLLPISFLEEGMLRAKSVARIELEDGAVGTGFLTKKNFLVTNHHVIPNEEVAATATIAFNYQQNIEGLDLKAFEYQCNPKKGNFKTCETHDWTVVKLKGSPNRKWGAIPIKPSSCDVRDRVVIIQHPAGSFKALGLYQNLVTSVTESRVQYLTDTMPGSSGSPVFNDDWDLVALHHSGGWQRDLQSKAILFRNEGVAVNVLYDGVKDFLK